MEAIFLACGAGGPQLKRNPLDSTARGIVVEHLLFICDSKPVRRGSKLARASLATLETPAGNVFMAFGSKELASTILTLFGAAEGVFLLPDTRIIPELVPAKSISPVLVFDTYDTYHAATSVAPHFPWAEHIIQYDFGAAAARASVELDNPDRLRSRPLE